MNIIFILNVPSQMKTNQVKGDSGVMVNGYSVEQSQEVDDIFVLRLFNVVKRNLS